MKLQDMKLYADARRNFPDPCNSGPDGLVAIGDEMSVELLLEAYTYGIFPWPHDHSPVLWFCPEERGVLDFDDFHISRSLKKFQSQNNYEISFNECFEDVIKNCAKVFRPNEGGTWINDHIVKHYIAFHKAGYAHSVECWMDGELAAGLYGVFVGGVFAGESMFFKQTGASKLCLIHLIEVLKDNGQQWMDIQMVSDLLLQFGGKYVGQKEFLQRLKQRQALAKPLELPKGRLVF